MKNLVNLLILIILVQIFACSDSPNPVNPNPVTPDSTVQLISPPNDTVFHLPFYDSIFVSFSWQRTENATNYHLQWALDSTFGNYPDNVYVGDTTFNQRFTKTNNIPNTSIIYYRVRIYNPVRPSPFWSQIRHFTITSP